MLDPFLQLDQLDVQLGELIVIFLPFELAGGSLIGSLISLLLPLAMPSSFPRLPTSARDRPSRTFPSIPLRGRYRNPLAARNWSGVHGPGPLADWRSAHVPRLTGGREHAAPERALGIDLLALRTATEIGTCVNW